MKKMVKLLFRLIKKKKLICISIVIIGMLAITMLVALLNSSSFLLESIDDYIKEYSLYDISFKFESINKDIVNIDTIRKMDDVKDACLRQNIDLPVTINEKKMACRCFSFNKDFFVKFRKIEEKKKSLELLNIYVELGFAKANDIHAGDTMDVCVEGNDISVFVNGIVTNPECISVKQNNYIFADRTDFGYIYVENKELKRYRLDKNVNEMIVMKEGNIDNHTLEKKIKDNLNINITSSECYEDSQVLDKIKENTDPLNSLAKNYPPIIFIISLIINVIFFYKLVYGYRREIGILLTMGYKKRNIYKMFLLMAGIFAIVAVVLGILGGYIINYVIYYLINDAMKMEFVLPRLQIKDFAMYIAVYVYACLGVALVSVYMVVHRLTPIDAISSKVGKKVTIIKSKKLSCGIKIELNRILRNIKTHAMSIVCIAVSMAFIYSSFLFYNAKIVAIDDLFSKRWNYDVTVTLSSRKDSSLVKDFMSVEGVKKCAFMKYTMQNILRKDKTKKEIIINGIQTDNDLIRIVDTKHNLTDMKQDGIVLESHLADEIDACQSDNVIINGNKIKVSLISRQDICRVNYINIDEFDKYFDDYYSVIVCNTSDYEKLEEYAKKRDDFFMISKKSEEEAHCKKIFSNSDFGVISVIVIGTLLGITIIFNMSEFIVENEKRVSMIKMMMGYSVKKIAKPLIFEDIVKFIIGSLVGLYAGDIIGKKTLIEMSSLNVEYPYKNDIWVYLLSLGIVFFVVTICNVRSIVKIKKMVPASQLKSVE